MAGKREKGGPAQGRDTAPRQPRQQAQREPQRAPGGVPPANAFDNLPKRPPPNLPPARGEAERQPGAGQARGAQRRPPAGAGAEGQGRGAQRGAAAPAPPPQKRREAPPKEPADPAKRRRNRRIAAVATVVLLVAAGFFFTVTTLFKIESFELEGECPYSLQEVVAAAGLEAGENLYSFTAGGAQRRIESALPYIEAVRVRRKLPSTIQFKVEPAVEAYCVAGGEGYAVLSASRKVLREAAEKPEGLLEIRGLSDLDIIPGQKLEQAVAAASLAAQQAASAGQAAGGAPASGSGTPEGDGDDSMADALEAAQAEREDAASRFAAMETLLAAMEAAGFAGADWVDVSDVLSLSFRWQGRITVQLGPRGGLDEKLAAAAVILENASGELVDEVSRGTLDMTYYVSTGQSFFRPE